MLCYVVHFRNGEILIDVGEDEQDVINYMQRSHPEKGVPTKSSFTELEGDKCEYA